MSEGDIDADRSKLKGIKMGEGAQRPPWLIPLVVTVVGGVLALGIYEWWHDSHFLLPKEKHPPSATGASS